MPPIEPSLYRLTSYEPSKVRSAVSDAFDRNAEVFEPLRSHGKDGLVVVKPNWIAASHEHDPSVWDCVITHPEVVMAVLACLADRMDGRGTIAVCDAPVTQADFSAVLERGRLRTRIEEFRAQWPALNIEILDLRREVWVQKEEVTVERRANTEDPRGYVRLNLGEHSCLHGHRGEGRYYGADYDTRALNSHHRNGLHEYLLSGTAMRCHLFVNLPKLKTHRKTGLTCSLKNLVGINGDKNWLPHHTEGFPGSGGDEFPEESRKAKLERRLKRVGQRLALDLPVVGPFIFRKVRRVGKEALGDSRRVIRAGNWVGNDTCWRMVLDLNRALLFGTPSGGWDSAAKPYLAIVDGIVAGQGMGPTAPDPASAGVILASRDPAQTDAIACALMGFDPRLVPMVVHAFDGHKWPISTIPLEGVTVVDRRVGTTTPLSGLRPAIDGGFVPHFGWTALRGTHAPSQTLSPEPAVDDGR